MWVYEIINMLLWYLAKNDYRQLQLLFQYRMTYMYDLFSNWDVVELTDMDIKLKDRVFLKKKTFTNYQWNFCIILFNDTQNTRYNRNTRQITQSVTIS